MPHESSAVTSLNKPHLLDLFCGAGGSARGYQLAGFHVTGVDNRPQPRYVGDAFILDDALEYVRQHGHEFDTIHASPPCQGYSIMRNLPWLLGKDYPLLIKPVLTLLRESGKPFILENVMGAKLDAGWLCGQMFGLPFFRHRLFASNVLWLRPSHPRHHATISRGRLLGSRASNPIAQPRVDNRARGKELSLRVYASLRAADGAGVGHAAGIALAREHLGVPWMRREEVANTVPPIYTEFIGRQLLNAL